MAVEPLAVHALLRDLSVADVLEGDWGAGGREMGEVGGGGRRVAAGGVDDVV